MTTNELPHGGTVRDLRVQVVKLAVRGNAVFERTLLATSGPMDAATKELNLMAHGAGYHGWALASVLRHIEEQFGPAAAVNAAAIVQNIAVDGGDEGYCDDLTDAEIGTTAAMGGSRGETL